MQLDDQVHLVCTQRDATGGSSCCSIEIRVFQKFTTTRGAEENVQAKRRITAWRYDMQGHVETCVERYCEVEKKIASLLRQVEIPCMVDAWEENWEAFSIMVEEHFYDVVQKHR